MGHYNPDWTITFYDGNVKHIFLYCRKQRFNEFNAVMQSKIHCAREHFKAISNGNVVYDVVDSYKSLMEKVMK